MWPLCGGVTFQHCMCKVVVWCTVVRWWYGVLLLGGGMVYCC